MPVRERRALRVLVVGPKYAAPDSRGGMATIVALMRDRHDDRFRITTVATYVDDRLWRRLVVGVGGMLRATTRVLARRTDVLHVHLAHRGSVVRKAIPLLAARLVGVPAVVHAHSYDFPGWFDGLPAPGRWLARHALPAHCWLALGGGLAEEYRSRMHLADDRVRVLTNPVVAAPAELFRPAERMDGSPVGVVALGRLGKRKGSYDLVAAVAKVDATTRGGLNVVAAGDGEVDELRQAAVDADVTDVVEVRDWLAPADRDQLLSQSEILALPSYAEGLPMALLEAMAWGLVPVVTPVGSIPEVVTDGVDAIVVEPGDVGGLASALTTLVADPLLRRRMGAAAQQRAGEFGLDLWFEELIALWTSISAQSR